MREWNLGAGDPLCLTLAADARLAAPDYCNDHIWELNLEGGEPPALFLYTTYGLRAGWLRLFPRFVRGNTALTDPASFAEPPRIKHFATNYIALECSPFQGIDARMEYWVPASQVVAGRLLLTNNTVLKESLRVEWAGLLSPLGEGESMSAVQTGSGYVLTGKTEELFPVCAVSGVPRPVSSPFPALALDIDLFPGNARQIHWALATLTDRDTSLAGAQQTLSAPWDAEIARIDLQQRHHELEIETGDPDWDAAFAFAQKTAFGSFFPASAYLPKPSFVTSRLPEQGYSPRGDGSDSPYAWNGQNAADSLYVASLILPGAPELARGLILNFLSAQEDGEIDYRPGMGGQRSRTLAQPLLATLAWRIEQDHSDPDWLAEVYPGLARLAATWLDPQHDRDQDGLPEWDHPLQTGYEDNPLFDRWDAQSQGMDIRMMESPALGAFLYREVTSLMKIARRLGRESDLPELEAQARRLAAAVQSTWDEPGATYRFRDRDTHHSDSGVLVKSFQGNGEYDCETHFDGPQRLLLRVHAQDGQTRAISLTIYGSRGGQAASETFEPRDFFWTRGIGRGTSEQLFDTVTRVEVQGIHESDRGWVGTIDFTQEAISLLLPLWAGIPDAEQADRLIDSTVWGRYLGPFGIPACPPDARSAGEPQRGNVYMLWNQLIGEGLLAYGRRKEAAELVTRLMTGIVAVLKTHHGFRQVIHAQSGQGSGERNVISGLPPLSLFLQTLGILGWNENELILQDFNPFPRTITVQYRGVRVTRREQDTTVIFPAGQTVTLTEPGTFRLSLT